jgi:prepilin-type N-terminal cleavage/methylation domain-containing protein
MTLIELMIAVVILSVVVAAAFSVSYSIMNSYREHRRAIGVERSVRGAIALLTEAVRGTSPGVPDGQITDLVACDSTFQGIRVTNFSDAPDAIELVYAKGGVVTTLRAEFNQDLNQITVENGVDLRPEDQVLVTDFDKGHIVRITDVAQSGPDWILTLASPTRPGRPCCASSGRASRSTWRTCRS